MAIVLPDNRILLLLRHGESTANADDVFGGWLDFPLTVRGRDQAAAAGRLIREKGLDLQAVHTSLLTRAIDTAEIAIAAATSRQIATQRSWRLNERHYGQLQGRRREDVRAEVGDELFGRWRRSYDLAPPNGEALIDVHARLLPYYQSAIAADLSADRVTLVVAHGNSLRALCMYLDGLAPREVHSLHIPTGDVLRYDLDEELSPMVRGGRYLRSWGCIDPKSAP